MHPLLYFVASMLSLALIRSMVYNSRRLETIGYPISVLFLQAVIAGHEDVFLICPQFPLYVSLKDKEPTPDETMPDSGARGVYVDHALLLPRVSQTVGNVKLSQAFRQDQNCNLHHFLYVNSLEVPLLEERKRAPTRHPKDLEEHYHSICDALAAAKRQVVSQARVLLSSLRFMDQEKVILVASAGEYYRIAVLLRDHVALSKVPGKDEIVELLAHRDESLDMNVVAGELQSQLVLPTRSRTGRRDQQRLAEQQADREEREKQRKARDARALVREQRQEALFRMKGHFRTQQQIVLDAGGPNPFYSDDWLEAYHDITLKLTAIPHFSQPQYFFQPEPHPQDRLLDLASLRNPEDDRDIVFSGIIRIGTPTSKKFIMMIQQYLSTLAAEERRRRGR